MILQRELKRANEMLNPAHFGRNGSGHDHVAQFYVNDAAIMDDAARFLANALAQGRPAIAIPMTHHCAGIEDRLAAAGIDLARATEQGRFQSIDAADILPLCLSDDGRLDGERFRRAVDRLLARCTPPAHDGKVAVFGEIVALLALEGRFDDTIMLEAFWNDLLGRRKIALFCGYPSHAFTRAEDTTSVQAILDAHATVIPDESFIRNGDDDKRSRSIALLQHRDRVARAEADRRTRAEHTLRLRESELAELLDHALDGIQRLDSDGIIRWANPAMLGLLGYEECAFTGTSFSAFQLDPERYAEFWATIARHEQPTDVPLELRHADGSAVSVLVRATCRWEGRVLADVRCLVRDVTAQRRMEQQLREQNEALTTALAARDEFLLIAAHELKTPITSLRIFTQLLERDFARHGTVKPERMGTALEAIERQSTHLAQLIGRLLDATTIDAGAMRIEPERADLAALVRTAVAEQAHAGTHRFAMEAPETLPARIDPIRFTQVVTNLLVNACRFSPQDTLVTVTLARDGDGVTRLSVTDHGVGVPAEQREHIFTRYHQAHAANHLSGMGLGLSIARQIVSLHGGAIWVEEPPHPGSRFVVTLPPSVAVV